VFGPTDLYVDTGRAEDEVSVPSIIILTAHMFEKARTILSSQIASVDLFI